MEAFEEIEVIQIDTESTYNTEYDERNGDDIGTERITSKEKRKLSSSSSAPAKERARKQSTCGREGFEDRGFERIDQEIYLNRSSMEAFEEERVIQIDKESTYNTDCEESDGDEIGTERITSKGKRKLRSSSSAPAKQRARKQSTCGNEGFEDKGFERIDRDTFLNHSKETRLNKEDDAQKIIIEKQAAHIKELRGIIKDLLEKDIIVRRKLLDEASASARGG